MDQGLKGLTQEQDNDCRAVLAKFIERHNISDWGSTVKVEEKSHGQFFVKIELTPRQSPVCLHGRWMKSRSRMDRQT
jgi:hypothetical protein